MDEKKMVDWLHDVCELREQVRVFGVGRRGPRDCLRARAARVCHAETLAHSLTTVGQFTDCKHEFQHFLLNQPPQVPSLPGVYSSIG